MDFKNYFSNNVLTVKFGERSGEDRKLYMQITDQSPEVVKFFSMLKNIGKDYYLTQNAIRIKMDAKPEFRDSQNTFYVRGYSKSEDLRIDETLFGTPKMKENKIALLKGALEEFSAAVNKASRAGLLDPRRYQFVSYDLVAHNIPKVRNENPAPTFDPWASFLGLRSVAYEAPKPRINWAIVNF